MPRLKVERREGSIERRILVGMIVDDVALSRIATRWEKEGLFRSKWSNMIAQWCVDHFAKYDESPGKGVASIFESWATDADDKETVELVERFLESLSNEYEHLADESNSDYIVDLASKHFNEVKLERLSESIKSDLESGKADKALKRVEKFAHVEVGASLGVRVILDEAAIKQAFKRKAKPLIEYPGALGGFFRDSLERDAFVAFMAPEKRGKTFWLQDVAWMGLQQEKRVAFFAVGDMSEGQMMLRFLTRAARRPLRATEPGKPIKFPTRLEHHPDESIATVEHDLREYDTDLKWRDALRTCKRIIRKRHLNGDLLNLACFPNSSISVSGIANVIETWDRTGWGLPDVVCIDYADILAPPHGIVESRDQINATWKGLRRLSQELHCLVVTATQSDADSYDVETMRRQNFSEDKRKFAHVTAMIGINQTAEEKPMGLQRLNYLVLREGEFYENQCVHVAGCLAVANPAILSTF